MPYTDYEIDGYFESPHDNPPSYLLMLTAYLDESGQESKDLVVIAGFLGNQEAWSELARQWKPALGSQRQSLHMKELRFSKESERQLLQRLAPIPVGCGLDPVCGGIRVSDYESLLPESTILGKLHSGYISALFPLLIHILSDVPDTERLELIFEEQNAYSFWTEIVLSSISASPLPMCWTRDGKPKLAKWGYVPKGSTSLLEPADFFAYSLLQYHRDPNSVKSQWCMPLLTSVDSVETIGRIYTKEEAQKEVTFMLNKLNSDPVMAQALERIGKEIMEARLAMNDNIDL